MVETSKFSGKPLKLVETSKFSGKTSKFGGKPSILVGNPPFGGKTLPFGGKTLLWWENPLFGGKTRFCGTRGWWGGCRMPYAGCRWLCASFVHCAWYGDCHPSRSWTDLEGWRTLLPSGSKCQHFGEKAGQPPCWLACFSVVRDLKMTDFDCFLTLLDPVRDLQGKTPPGPPRPLAEFGSEKGQKRSFLAIFGQNRSRTQGKCPEPGPFWHHDS